MLDKISRRTFLGLTGGTGAGLALGPGKQFIDKLIPYVNPPEYPKPGEWAFFSTTCRECPAGCGLLMWHRDGRVTKADGHPDHPVNKGKICIRGQAAVQGLYNKNRLKDISTINTNKEKDKTSWDKVIPEIKKSLQNKKIKILSSLQTSSMREVINAFGEKFNTTPLFYEPVNYESIRKAYNELLGIQRVPKTDLSKSDLIISCEADFLESWCSPVEYASTFSTFHSCEQSSPGTLVYLGPSQTLTANNADEVYLTKPSDQWRILSGVADKLSQKLSHGITELIPDIPTDYTEEEQTIIQNLTKRIQKAESPLVLAGAVNDSSESGKLTVQLAYLLNELIGASHRFNFNTSHAIGNSVFSEELEIFFKNLSSDDILIVHDTNPAYYIPWSIKYLEQVAGIIYIGSNSNETSLLAQWILPSHHYMEDWNDYEYIDGSISLMQPVMNPLYDTKSAGDIFLSLMDESTAFKEKVRTNWLKWNGIGEISNDQEIERFYAGKLRKGVLERKTKISIDLKLKQIGKPPKTIKLASEEKFFLKASPSLFFYDGHLSDRPWLQEIPHVTSNISWQSWADINKTKAESLNISEGDIIELKNEDRAIQVPAHLCENIHPDVINIEIGQGRKYIYDDVKGVNAYLLSSPLHRLNTSSVTIKKTGTHKQLLKLHPTKDQHSRKLLKYTPKDHLESANFKKEDIRLPLPEGYKKDQDLYPPHEHDTYRWAMVIDLQKCIGCKACEAACYAENNIPVVGEKSCYDGLEMSWLKVIPYKTENNKLAYLPQPCQHCDAAPCEPVCPVFASVHNEEGLNAQIYNRCIGTRYCSNNCPYKVRRFNWKNIKHEYPMNLQLNPEVTVRERGVMEKCTFCIQRINNAKHQALKEEREIKDGEVTPACAQTCPTEAIVFGNLMDENSKVSKLIDHKRRYQLLGKLNTKPAVIYLKKVMLNNKI